MVKDLPAVWETWVRSLGWEDPLEKGMATYSSILAWRIPWTEEPGGLQSMGLQRVGHDWATFTFNSVLFWYTSVHTSYYTYIFIHIVTVVQLLSRVWFFVTPWTVARQAPLFMELSRQEYWSGLPFPSPGDLPNPGISCVCCIGRRILYRCATGKPYVSLYMCSKPGMYSIESEY